MKMPIFESAHFRLRPSVSMTPLPQSGRFQFFISDTRQSLNIIFSDRIYVDILRRLDGSLDFAGVIGSYGLNERQKTGLAKLFEILIECCVIEDLDALRGREADPFRRVKNFLASCVPYYRVERVWERIGAKRAVVIGVGGIGSWVVSLLAQSGVRRFLLVDDDIVKPHNLNRSVFASEHVGLPKTAAISSILERRLGAYCQIEEVGEKLHDPGQLIQLMRSGDGQDIIINCGDFPSAAITSHIINEAAFRIGASYIIAGGYNMHLSLIGPTVIPGETPCFNCISHAAKAAGEDSLAGYERVVRHHRNLGNLAPLAAISASFAAGEFLRLASGEASLRPVMAGKKGEFNFLSGKLKFEEYQRWPGCPTCGA